MEELIKIIQHDPELWEIVENLKHPDQEPMEFFESVANMFALEFEELPLLIGGNGNLDLANIYCYSFSLS